MIKKLELSKMDDVMQIWLQANIKAHDFIPEIYWLENYDFVKKVLPQSNVLVYEDDGEIKGFIGVIDKSYIAGLFVSNQHQSNGIGSKLIDKCKQDHTVLKLDVYAKNLKAVEFYKKHGFKIEEEKENDDANEMEYSMIWRA